MTQHQNHLTSASNEKKVAPGERAELSETGRGSERPRQGSGKLQIPVRRARKVRRKRKGRKHGQHAMRLGR